MEAGAVFAGVGVAAAFAMGALVGGAVSAHAGRRRAMVRAMAEPGDSAVRAALAGVARNGVAPCMPPARWLLRNETVARWADGAVVALEEQGVFAVREAVVSVFATAMLIAGVFASVVSGTFAAGIAVAGCIGAAALAAVARARESRTARMRESVPDALRCMAACFQAGLSLPQAFDQVARETEQGVGPLFRRAANMLQMGHSTAEALQALRGEGAEGLAFAAVALDVRHEAGGSASHALEAACEAAQSELDLQRSLSVQTAQAKLSARIVTAMPFVLVAVFSLVSEGFLAPFFASPLGMAMLAVALAMQVAGVFAVRRTLRVEAG